MEKNEIKSEETKNLTEKKETESKENESKPIEKLDETPKKTNKNDLSSKNANENEKKIFLFISMLLMKNQRNLKYIYPKNIKASTHLKKLRKRN